MRQFVQLSRIFEDFLVIVVRFAELNEEGFDIFWKEKRQTNLLWKSLFSKIYLYQLRIRL